MAASELSNIEDNETGHLIKIRAFKGSIRTHDHHLSLILGHQYTIRVASYTSGQVIRTNNVSKVIIIQLVDLPVEKEGIICSIRADTRGIYYSLLTHNLPLYAKDGHGFLSDHRKHHWNALNPSNNPSRKVRYPYCTIGFNDDSFKFQIFNKQLLFSQSNNIAFLGGNQPPRNTSCMFLCSSISCLYPY